MGYQYVILGAGIQGTTIAYDMAKFGEASGIKLLDVNQEQAEAAARKVNQLIGQELVQAGAIDVKNEQALKDVLQEADSCLSAVPYFLNPLIARCAVETKTNFCDLGGNTAIVKQELELHEQALAAGVSVIPDCGVAPGMANTFAVYGMEQLDSCEEVQLRVGGLPQHPEPPLDYMLVFNIEGLTNEYFGEAVILRNGKVETVPTFAELETLELPAPLGTCEAFTTSGGTSTAPWTFAGKINTYEYKTIRYPGHYEKFKLLLDLGLLDLNPVQVQGQSVIPRQVFHSVVTPKLTKPEGKDLLIFRVACRGLKDGQPKTLQYTILDFQDEATGFNAMSRMTGFPASLVAIMMAQGRTLKGAIPLELSVPAAPFVEEFKKRGIAIQEEIF